jgi:hypothetical protein
MIAFGLPWVLGVAVAAALTITALHLLSVRRPPELLLPTARFLPERDVRAVSRTKRPSDVWLLLVRVALLLAAGLAIAEPYWPTRATGDVVLVVADATVRRDTVALERMLGLAQTTRPTRVVYVFADSHRVEVGDVAALLPLGVRSAAQLVQRDATIDSLDLHLFAREAARDTAAYGAWRAVWPGRVTTHVAAAASDRGPVVIVDQRGVGLTGSAADQRETAGDDLRAEPRDARRDARRDAMVDASRDDIVRVALAWHAARLAGATRDSAARPDTVVLDRRDVSEGTPADARDERAVERGVRLSWPASGVPRGWVAKREPDSVSAIAVGGRALRGPWAVMSLPADTVSLMPLAWWSDGRVAATERRVGSGCDRQIALVDASAGDVLLSSSANALFDRLLGPCAAETTVAAAALVVRAVNGTGRASAQHFRRPTSDAPRSVMTRTSGTSWVTPLLLFLATALLFVEWRVRRERVAT